MTILDSEAPLQQIYNIRRSRTSAAWNLAQLCIITAICITIAASTIGRHDLDHDLKVLRFLAILIIALLVPMLVRSTRNLSRFDYDTPIVTINSQGFQDRRIANSFIPWQCVTGLHFSKGRPRIPPYIACYLSSESKNVLGEDLVGKIWTSATRYSQPVVCIRRGFLDMELSDAYQIMNTFHRTYKPNEIAAQIDAL
ncbi:hypothetical protein ACQZ6F_19880 [Rhizobium sp. A22-96]